MAGCIKLSVKQTCGTLTLPQCARSFVPTIMCPNLSRCVQPSDNICGTKINGLYNTFINYSCKKMWYLADDYNGITFYNYCLNY